MSKVNRIEWVDLLKGVAILWLIVYHMHVFEWMRSPVPVFFFLSGLLYSEGMSFGSFVGKKAKALLLPLAFFFVLGVAASTLKCLMQGEAYSFPPLWLFLTLIPAGAEITNPLGVGAIWFLVSLFEIYIIYYALRRVSKNRWWLLSAAILLFLISCIALHYYAHGSLFYLFYTFGFCIYFIVAHLLRDKVLYGRIPLLLLGMGVVAYCTRFVEVPDGILNGGMGGGNFDAVKRSGVDVWTHYSDYMVVPAIGIYQACDIHEDLCFFAFRWAQFTDHPWCSHADYGCRGHSFETLYDYRSTL